MPRINDIMERLAESDALAWYSGRLDLAREKGRAVYHRDKGKYGPYAPRRLDQRWSQIQLRRHFLSQGIPCQVCGSTDRLEVSHKVSVHDGGPDTLSNVEWLCHDCHLAYASPAFM